MIQLPFTKEILKLAKIIETLLKIVYEACNNLKEQYQNSIQNGITISTNTNSSLQNSSPSSSSKHCQDTFSKNQKRSLEKLSMIKKSLFRDLANTQKHLKKLQMFFDTDQYRHYKMVLISSLIPMAKNIEIWVESCSSGSENNNSNRSGRVAEQQDVPNDENKQNPIQYFSI